MNRQGSVVPSDKQGGCIVNGLWLVCCFRTCMTCRNVQKQWFPLRHLWVGPNGSDQMKMFEWPSQTPDINSILVLPKKAVQVENYLKSLHLHNSANQNGKIYPQSFQRLAASVAFGLDLEHRTMKKSKKRTNMGSKINGKYFCEPLVFKIFGLSQLIDHPKSRKEQTIASKY